MRIVIDMQGAQSLGSRNRGIGRYTLWLAQALVKNRGTHEILLALNDSFPETLAGIRKIFAGMLPEENVLVWPMQGMRMSGNALDGKAAEQNRESFLADLKPDMLLICSLFEGLEDQAVTSIKCWRPEVPTASVLYDLIPLIHPDRYLGNPRTDNWYKEKLQHAKRADLLLAISESARNEGIAHLERTENDCVNISGAIDPEFRVRAVGDEEAQDVRNRHGLHRSFIMYLAGPDPRKNVDGLIKAYSILPKALRAVHQLAIVCAVAPEAKQDMLRMAKTCGLQEDEVIFTGFVSDTDLKVLYNLCELFVFPSWHEGLGLPALEAMACGKAVIGANVTSLPEVIGREDALFDPFSAVAIAASIERVLTDEQFREELARYGRKRSQMFSWDATAIRALEAMEAHCATLKCESPAGCDNGHAGVTLTC